MHGKTMNARELARCAGPAADAFPLDVVELLRRKTPSPPYLHELLAGSVVKPPEGPAPKKTDPAYERHMDAVRAQLEEREYDRMTLDVRRRELMQNDAGEISGAMCSLGEGLNILVAKGTAFAVGYFASMAAGREPVWNIICGINTCIHARTRTHTLHTQHNKDTATDTQTQTRTRMNCSYVIYACILYVHT